MSESNPSRPFIPMLKYFWFFRDIRVRKNSAESTAPPNQNFNNAVVLVLFMSKSTGSDPFPILFLYVNPYSIMYDTLFTDLMLCKKVQYTALEKRYIMNQVYW